MSEEWDDAVRGPRMPNSVALDPCPDCRVRAGDDHLPGCTVSAAAPELLKALKLCVIRDPSLLANAMVAEAIAKAEGQS